MRLARWTLFVFLAACTPSGEETVEAARTGDTEVVRRGLGSLDAAEVESALRAAIEAGQVGTARQLLARGEPGYLMSEAGFAQADDGEEPFAVSAEMATLLLDHGADGGVYLLPHAVRTGDVELARAVLEHPRVHVRATGPEGAAWLRRSTMHEGLFVAAERGDTEMVRLLLRHGASADDASYSAVIVGNVEVLRVALAGGGDADAALVTAVSRELPRRAAIVGLLLEGGAQHARALTQLAARADDVESAQLLVEHGATDLDAALVNARREEHRGLVELLTARLEETAPPQL